MKTTNLLLSGLLLSLTIPLIQCQGEPPPAVTQGRFAWVLSYYLEKGTNSFEEAQHNLEIRLIEEKTEPPKEEIQKAIESLSGIGLSPYLGWRTDEPVRRHDVTSLLVIAYDKNDSVDIQDPEACLAFTTGKGFDLNRLSEVCRYILEQKNSPCSVEQIITQPISVQPDPQE
jgi:hypothetical protein